MTGPTPQRLEEIREFLRRGFYKDRIAVRDLLAALSARDEALAAAVEALGRLASMQGFEGAGHVGGATFAERELRARGLYAERAFARVKFLAGAVGGEEPADA